MPSDRLPTSTNRELVSSRIVSCTRCGLRKQCRQPVPPSWGASKILVLGEAPGSAEDKAGIPFVGPAGSILRSMLKKVSINPDHVTYTNSVQCYPSRTPTYDELVSCRSHRWEAIVAAEPDYIIVAGSVALSTIRPDLKITQIHGRPLYWGKGEQLDGRIQHWADRVLLWPIYHPAAALNTRNPQLQADIQSDLYEFIFRVRSGWEGFRDTWPTDCVVCKSELTDHVDENGVYYCDRHFARQLTLVAD